MKILYNSRAASNESQTNLFLPSKFLCTFYRLFYNKQQMMKGPCSYLFSVYYVLKSPKYPFILLDIYYNIHNTPASLLSSV